MKIKLYSSNKDITILFKSTNMHRNWTQEEKLLIQKSYFSVRFVARSDVYHIVQQSISIIRAVQTQFLHQFLPRAYHFPIRNIISHRSFRIVSNYIHLQHESSVITLILLQLYFDKYVFINVFFNIYQICYYRFSMYLNAKQKVHLHNAMDNYKPRANFSTMHKFHNPLTKLGRICTRRIDLTYAQHVNMKAHHSSAPFCNSKSNKYLVFIKLYSFYTIIDHMYSHVYKFFYISIVE